MRFVFLSLGLIALLTLYLALNTSVQLSPDGIRYLSIAEGLQRGVIIRSIFPPGYPALLAMTRALLGLNGLQAAEIVNLAVYLLFSLFSWIFVGLTRFRGATKALVWAVTVANPLIFIVLLYTLSDLFFLICVQLVVYAILRGKTALGYVAPLSLLIRPEGLALLVVSVYILFKDMGPKPFLLQALLFLGLLILFPELATSKLLPNMAISAVPRKSCTDPFRPAELWCVEHFGDRCGPFITAQEPEIMYSMLKENIWGYLKNIKNHNLPCQLGFLSLFTYTSVWFFLATAYKRNLPLWLLALAFSAYPLFFFPKLRFLLPLTALLPTFLEYLPLMSGKKSVLLLLGMLFLNFLLGAFRPAPKYFQERERFLRLVAQLPCALTDSTVLAWQLKNRPVEVMNPYLIRRKLNRCSFVALETVSPYEIGLEECQVLYRKAHFYLLDCGK